MLARRLRLSLLALHVVGIATLLRSVAYDRWITVLASLFLIAGTMAARRGKTWGIGMAFAASASFPVAFAIGIAPAWFCLVGLAGALPLALTFRPLARFDKGAAVLLASLAGAAGAAAAMAWKEMAWTVFTTFPSLRPSLDAQHGIALATTLAVVVGALAGRSRQRKDAEEAHAYVRVAEPTRVSMFDEDDAERFDTVGALDEGAGDDADARLRRRTLR